MNRTKDIPQDHGTKTPQKIFTTKEKSRSETKPANSKTNVFVNHQKKTLSWNTSGDSASIGNGEEGNPNTGGGGEGLRRRAGAVWFVSNTIKKGKIAAEPSRFSIGPVTWVRKHESCFHWHPLAESAVCSFSDEALGELLLLLLQADNKTEAFLLPHAQLPSLSHPGTSS